MVRRVLALLLRNAAVRAVLLAGAVWLPGWCCARHCAPGTIVTVAGSGEWRAKDSEDAGDGGPAIRAKLVGPCDVAITENGVLYIADTFNNRIRRVDAKGIITTFAGSGLWNPNSEEFVGAPDALFGPGYAGDGGPAAKARLSFPYSVAVSADKSVYIADTQNHRIRKVNAKGIISTVAGTGEAGYGGDGGPATKAKLRYPHGLAISRDGSLYIVDKHNQRIRRIDPKGIISTIAGTGKSAYMGDGGPANKASLCEPEDVALAPDGSLYIADRGNNRVRKVDSHGIITTVAGTGTPGISADSGPANKTALADPKGVCVGPDGSLYIADHYSHRIRRVDSAGIISTVAGDGWNNGNPHMPMGRYHGDGSPPLKASLNGPASVTIGADGSIYICDFYNNRVRKVCGGMTK